MKTVLLALLVLGVALAPMAAAHHTGCQEPDTPCNPWPPCDAKCWLTHFKHAALCLVDESFC